jgi:hypothetical protein
MSLQQQLPRKIGREAADLRVILHGGREATVMLIVRQALVAAPAGLPTALPR